MKPRKSYKICIYQLHELKIHLHKTVHVLAGVAQLVGALSIHQKVEGSIPGQSTCLGWGFSPWLGCVQEATDVSPSLSPSLPLSLKAISMFLGEDTERKEGRQERESERKEGRGRDGKKRREKKERTGRKKVLKINSWKINFLTHTHYIICSNI